MQQTVPRFVASVHEARHCLVVLLLGGSVERVTLDADAPYRCFTEVRPGPAWTVREHLVVAAASDDEGGDRGGGRAAAGAEDQ